MSRRQNPSDNTFLWLALFGIGGYYLYKSGWLSKILAGPSAPVPPAAFPAAQQAPVIITRPNSVAAPPPPGIIVQRFPTPATSAPSAPVSFTPGGPLAAAAAPPPAPTAGPSVGVPVTPGRHMPVPDPVPQIAPEFFNGPMMYDFLVGLGKGEVDPSWKNYTDDLHWLFPQGLDGYLYSLQNYPDFNSSELHNAVTGNNTVFLVPSGGEAVTPISSASTLPSGTTAVWQGTYFVTESFDQLLESSHNIQAASLDDAKQKIWGLTRAIAGGVGSLKMIIESADTHGGFYRVTHWWGFQVYPTPAEQGDIGR